MTTGLCESRGLTYSDDDQRRLVSIDPCHEVATETRTRARGETRRYCAAHAARSDAFSAQLKVRTIWRWQELGAAFMLDAGHTPPVLTPHERRALAAMSQQEISALMAVRHLWAPSIYLPLMTV